MSSASDDGLLVPTFGFGLQSADVIPLVLALTALASGLSGQEPTGNSLADFALPALLGAGTVWLSRWATPRSLLLSSVLALFFTSLLLPWVILGVVAVASAYFIGGWRPFDHESSRIARAVSAGLITQVVLNLPNVRWVGSASILAAVALAPVLWQAWKSMPRGYRKRAYWLSACVLIYAAIAAALAGYAALSARDSVEVGIRQAQDGVAALEAGRQNRAVALLDAAQQNFENASGRLEGPLTWPGRVVPVVAQHSRAIETAAIEGSSLARTAVRVVERADVKELRGQNGAVDLALIADINIELANANIVLLRAQEAITAVRTVWLLPQVDQRLEDVQIELAATTEDIDLANQATSVLPQILGGDGPRRYLVLFVQPSEAREFGGFVGAYGILEARDGQLSLAESGSIDTDIGDGEAEFTDPAQFPQFYRSQFPQQNPQNLTGIADLPTIAAAARDLVPQWRNDPSYQIDGVVTLDPYAIAGLLELTGPIAVAGRAEPVAADNVVDFLLREQYVEFDAADRNLRQDALAELAGTAFGELLRIELPGPERLGAIFGPIARANRMSFITFDDHENVFLDRVLLSAQMPVVGELVEMLGVNTATGVASKLDAYVTRSMTYEVTVDPGTGEARGVMDIALTNAAPADAGEYVLGGSADERAPSPSGDPVPPGGNLMLVSLYSRADIADLESPDAEFSPVEPEPALGYTRSSIVVEVPLDTTKHITFTTRSMLGRGRYDVAFTAQQSANVGDVTLIVRPTAGWRIVGETPASDGSFTVTVPLDRSRGFTIFFERS